MHDLDRAFLAAAARDLSRQAWSIFIVTPDVLVRWHKALNSFKWRLYSRRRRPGRGGISTDSRELVLKPARDNASWGYKRIKGELKGLGINVSETTVRKILRRDGLDPPPGAG